jgi:hypothetical protein
MFTDLQALPMSSHIHPVSGRAPFVASEKLIVKDRCQSADAYHHLLTCGDICTMKIEENYLQSYPSSLMPGPWDSWVAGAS